MDQLVVGVVGDTAATGGLVQLVRTRLGQSRVVPASSVSPLAYPRVDVVVLGPGVQTGPATWALLRCDNPPRVILWWTSDGLVAADVQEAAVGGTALGLAG